MNIQTENETIKNLLQKNKIMNKALVRTFLENKDNFNLFEKAIANPTQENMIVPSFSLIILFSKKIRLFTLESLTNKNKSIY